MRCLGGGGCLCLDSEHDGPLCSLTYTVTGLRASYIPVISDRAVCRFLYVAGEVT